VDQPPLSILLLKISRIFFGDSLTAIRLFPALAGALTVLLTGLIAKELGGKRFAQLFAGLCVLLAPLHLALNSFYSMNAFDILFWTATVYFITLWIKWKDPGMWILLGVVLGLGLQNKISVLWLGLGLAVGLVLTKYRRSFLTRGPWLAGGIAFLIFLPHVIWQTRNGWPTLQFMAGATGSKMLTVSPLAYLGSQVMEMNPLLFPVWLAGLTWYLFSRKGRPYRILGILYLSVFALLVTSGNARSSYLAPAYPMLFASGALVLDKVTDKVLRRSLRYFVRGALVALTLAGGVAIAPLALPVLPVETYINYAAALDAAPSTEERHEVGVLGQFFADMQGWGEIVATVGSVYEKVKTEKAQPGEDGTNIQRWAVLAGNYGNAGAIDFLGKEYGLPPAISGHNNYWLWGPGDPPPQNLIILGGQVETYMDMCGEVRQADTIECGYCMPYENNRPVIVCRGLQVDTVEWWEGLKHYE
jgi:4-amino-4-deoxy-L-arabinose transferase-like glycosyltransferase